MKWNVVLCFCAVLFCVNESHGFKILKKLKDYLHPTTTVSPTVPAYGSHHHSQTDDDSRSWEHESSTTSATHQSEEDSSNSQSSEKTGGSFSNSNKKYNSMRYDKTKPNAGNSFNLNTYTTSTIVYDNVYGNNDEKTYFSNDNFNNRESQTSTDRYDQSNNNEYFPDQSSSNGFSNQETISTTIDGRYDQNQFDQSPGGFSNPTFQTSTASSNNGGYGFNSPQQSSSFGGVDSDTVVSGGKDQTFIESSSYNFGFETTTMKFGNSRDQNNNDQSSVFNIFNEDNQQSSTPKSGGSYYGSNNPQFNGGSTTTSNYDGFQDQNNDQSSVFNIFSEDKPQSSTPKTGSSYYENNKPQQSFNGGSTTTSNYEGFQHQNNEDQLSIFIGSNKEISTSTTPNTDYNNNNYNFGKSNQSSSSFDTFDEQTNGKSNRTQNSFDQSSYDNINDEFSSTTNAYDNTNYNEVSPEQSSGSNNGGTSVPSTSTSSNDQFESSLQGSDQQNQTSGSRPSYSSSQGSSQSQNSDDDGKIIFPDDPSLDPTTETLRIFERGPPHPKHPKGLHKKTPAPVNDEEGRHIIDAPTKKNCGSGQTYDKQKNICKQLARK